MTACTDRVERSAAERLLEAVQALDDPALCRGFTMARGLSGAVVQVFSATRGTRHAVKADTLAEALTAAGELLRAAPELTVLRGGRG